MNPEIETNRRKIKTYYDIKFNQLIDLRIDLLEIKNHFEREDLEGNVIYARLQESYLCIGSVIERAIGLVDKEMKEMEAK